VPFETCLPVRGPFLQGTAPPRGALVDRHDELAGGSESWLGRERLIMFDFDPRVVEKAAVACRLATCA
jgi:hypothetical protein